MPSLRPLYRSLVPALLVAVAAATPNPASAGCEGGLSPIAPRRATSQDRVKLGARGSEHSTCVPEVESFEVDHEAKSVSILGRLPTSGCGPTEEWISYRLEVETPVLEPGDWQLSVSIPGGCALTADFTVASAGRQGAGGRAGASLLFPYFQVDLDSGDGLTTLLAIGNSSTEDALTHVVLWTDWGIPTFAFDVHLPGDAVQTLNLRDVFQSGRLPVTGAAASFPDCASPIETPPLGPARRAVLRAQHTGQPDPDDGLCYGSTRRSPNIATGFVTVDLVHQCTDGLAYPTALDTRYFAPDGTGLAASRNVLFGDYFYVDAPGNHAQGLDAVPIVADGEISAELRDGFYRAGAIPGEDRVPLPGRYRTRFLSGGAFDGNTSVIVWRWDISLWDSAKYGPIACDAGPPPPTSCQWLEFHLYDEAGNPLETHTVHTPLITGIYEIGGPEVPVATPFGSVQVENLELGGCYVIPTGPFPRPAWVTPLLTAEGRFSVGLRATPVE